MIIIIIIYHNIQILEMRKDVISHNFCIICSRDTAWRSQLLLESVKQRNSGGQASHSTL
jgi:hypothetical protein